MLAANLFAQISSPIIRITTPHIPLPAADQLEDAVVPSIARIVNDVKRALDSRRAA